MMQLYLVLLIEGPPNKKSKDSPVHLLNLRPTHPPSDFFFLGFFFSTFLGVSRQGEFKNTKNTFLQKVHVEDFFNDVSFSSTFLSFSGGLWQWESKSTTKKTFCKTNRVEKLLQTIRPNKSIFGRFSAPEGSSKTR
jgi:hypothetical protein